jgi:hypothetical protein
VSNRNVFRLTYLLFIPLAPGFTRDEIKCYCFPTFKDLLAVSDHPIRTQPTGVIFTGVQRYGPFYFYQIFLPVFRKLLESFGMKINLFSEELTPVFWGGRQR